MYDENHAITIDAIRTPSVKDAIGGESTTTWVK
jgi:hypothetical protein